MLCRKTIMLGIAVLWLAMDARGSAAQTVVPADQDGEQIDDIVVTAQKREQSANSVGLSINAASGEQLKDLGVTDVAGLVRIVPGLTVQETQYNTPVYTLRGIGFYEASLAATPAVSVYVDEVALPYPALTKLATLDLERVEVLKGPQGTLYGQNSTGGAINYIAAKPLRTFASGADVSFGRFNTLDVQAYVTGPVTETLSARAAVRAVRSDDWQRSYTRDDTLGSQKQVQGRLILEWRPTGVTSVSISADGWRDRSDTPAAQLIAVAPQNPAALPAAFLNYPVAPRDARAADWTPGVQFVRDDSYYRFAARGDIDLGADVALTSITSYQHYDTMAQQDADGTTFRDPNPRTFGSIKSFSQEVRLAGDIGRSKWLAGANYQTDAISDRFLLDVTDGSNTRVFGIKFNASDNRAATRARTLGVFGNVELYVSDRVMLQGGLRYNNDRRDFNGCTYDGDGGIARIFTTLSGALAGSPLTPALPVGACATLGADRRPAIASLRLRNDNLSWRAGVNIKPNRGSLIYANISRGYKAGSFPTLAASTIAQFAPVTPESVTAYEVGAKLALLDRRVQFNAAAFYYDYTDKQLRARVPDPVFGTLEALVNIPRSRIYGAEVQLTVQPTRGLTVNSSATYVNSRITEFTGININSERGSFAGTNFPYSPRWTAGGDSQYDFAVRSGITGFIGANINYQASTNAALTLPGSAVSNLTRLQGRTLLDLRAGFAEADDAWKVMIWGRNVTNAYYQTNIIRGNDTVFGYAGRPVTYGMTLSVRVR